MLFASLLLIPFVFFRRNITKPWGLGLTGLYVAYLLFLLS
jgi:cation:H+ antiporter